MTTFLLGLSNILRTWYSIIQSYCIYCAISVLSKVTFSQQTDFFCSSLSLVMSFGGIRFNKLLRWNKQDKDYSATQKALPEAAPRSSRGFDEHPAQTDPVPTVSDRDGDICSMDGVMDNAGREPSQQSALQPSQEQLEQIHQEQPEKICQEQPDHEQPERTRQEQPEMSLELERVHRTQLEQIYQDKLLKAQKNIQVLAKENGDLLDNINELYIHLQDASIENRNLKQRYEQFQQFHHQQMQKFEKLAKSYEDLDKKYMDVARALQVTGDDRSTIGKQLQNICSSIENLIRGAKGKGSCNLNKNAAIDLFRYSGLLQDFPIQEGRLESLHLNLFMESAVMEALIDSLFRRSLECIFDQSGEFESICEWVESRGSKAAVRWRQELCILIAQDGEEMARRKEHEVVETARALESMLSSVYGNLDTAMFDKIRELCSLAFDVSFAMLGMESVVYPVPSLLGTPFQEDHMTMAMRSDPNGPIALVVFPSFQDCKHRLYFKAKVWCSSTPDLLISESL